VRQDAAAYLPSDAWLLLAILLASREKPASLDQIIAAGDFINHAIFNPDELERGLSRLSAGRLIKERQGKFTVTRKVSGYYERKITSRRTIFNQLKDMERLLNVTA
jgi:hypothetical protein